MALTSSHHITDYYYATCYMLSLSDICWCCSSQSFVTKIRFTGVTCALFQIHELDSKLCEINSAKWMVTIEPPWYYATSRQPLWITLCNQHEVNRIIYNLINRRTKINKWTFPILWKQSGTLHLILDFYLPRFESCLWLIPKRKHHVSIITRGFRSEIETVSVYIII